MGPSCVFRPRASTGEFSPFRHRVHLGPAPERTRQRRSIPRNFNRLRPWARGATSVCAPPGHHQDTTGPRLSPAICWTRDRVGMKIAVCAADRSPPCRPASVLVLAGTNLDRSLPAAENNAIGHAQHEEKQRYDRPKIWNEFLVSPQRIKGQCGDNPRQRIADVFHPQCVGSRIHQ